MAGKTNGAINLDREAMHGYAQLATSVAADVEQLVRRVTSIADEWDEMCKGKDLEEVAKCINIVKINMSTIQTQMDDLGKDTVTLANKFGEMAVDAKKSMRDAKEDLFKTVQAIKNINA